MSHSSERGAELLRFTVKKLVQFIVVLWIVSILIFLMVRVSGTDPVAIILGGKQTSAEAIANLRTKFNLDKPLPVQYGLWISGILRGDFGLDFKYQQPVMDLIAARLPVTLWLVLMSSVIALVIAIPLGVLSAHKKNTWVDSAAQMVSLLSVSCPSFFISILTVALISRVAPQIQFTGGFSTFSQMMGRLLLPAICLALSMIALASRIIRTGMIEQGQSGYVQTARANGLGSARILWKHTFKNAVIPLITVVSIQIGSMLVGAVMVEEIFSLVGIGGLLITAIQSSNYPVVQGITILMVFIFLLITTIVDILYAVIDPRIRTGVGGDDNA